MKKYNIFSYTNWSFKKKLLAIISALIIAIVIFISFASYTLYSKNFTKQTINQTQQIIEQVAINVDNYLDELFRLNLSPYYNDEIMKELEIEYDTKTSNLSRKRSIENFLASVMILPRSEILRVYILTDNNLYSYSRTPYDMEDYNDYKNTSWYQQAVADSPGVFVPIHSEKVYGDKLTQIFSIAQRIRSKEDNSKVLAVIKVDANYSGIQSICDKVELKEKGSLFILDQDKSIIYQNDTLNFDNLITDLPIDHYLYNGNYTLTINSKKYIINVASLTTSDLKVVAVNSYNELTKNSKAIRNMTILLALFCLILAVSILFLFVQSFLKPLFQIVSSMKRVQNGDLTVSVNIKPHDEIGYLAKSFNHMVQRINKMMVRNTQLVKEVYETRYLQKEAQYNILCSQIKPHFLYNTLNTISLLIKCKDTEGAILSIEKLSYFLRGIMNADKNIPLSTELAIVDSYLGIQKARYGDNLTYEIDISKDYANYPVPALSLQPIVENAIIHGCEMKRGSSVIRIFSSIKDHNFLIHIIDNGIGMDEEKQKSLNEELSLITTTKHSLQENDSITESMGLINVSKRIKLKYGEEYGIQIISSSKDGTQIIIKLPLIDEIDNRSTLK